MEEEGSISSFRILPEGVRALSPLSGTPAVGFDTGTMRPLTWFEDQWDLEGCKKWTLLSHMHKLA